MEKQINPAERYAPPASQFGSATAGDKPFIIGSGDRILITGAAGFLGSRVVTELLSRGFHNLACFVRPSGNVEKLETMILKQGLPGRVDIIRGNLLSPTDCDLACKDVKVVLHLAAGTGQKSFADAVLNSVVTTRNLLEASSKNSSLRRFVLVSSFTVYTNQQKSPLLDETCPTESHPQTRGDAYCFAKVKQEQIVRQYAAQFGSRYVIVRPGSVYGGDKPEITGRVGLGTFGLFLHLGGSNKIPFTYVDNCASAVVLAGLVSGVDGEVFNVVDDDVPSSRQFLRAYKRNVRSFRSLYVPRPLSYALCYLWERYSQRSKGQLPPAFTRSQWYSQWRNTRYSNRNLKAKLGWSPVLSTPEAMSRYFAECREKQQYA